MGDDTGDMTMDLEGISIEVEYRYSPGSPGRTNCLPEDAEPPSGGSIDIVAVRVGGVDIAGIINPDYMDGIEKQVIEWEEGKFDDGPDEPDEPDYD